MGLQLVRFALVGVVNTGVFYGCYLSMHPYLPYFLAFTLAFAAGMVCSYFLNTYVTYRTRPSWRKFLLFPLTYLVNYLVTSVGVLALVNGLGVGTRIAPLIAAVLAIPFTFLLSRRILLPEALRQRS